MMNRIALLLALSLLLWGCTDDTASSTSTVPPTTSAPSTTAPSATTTTPPSDPRIPVIFDYSPTVSDVGALAFLASHPDLRLLAVTLPGTGESYCEPGVAHTRGMLETLGLGDVPVACGPEDPTTGFNAFPTSWRVGSNEMDLPEAAPNEQRTAPELIADILDSIDTPVQVVAVGPLTNLAVALQSNPRIAGSIAGITIMGGAVDVPGNVFRNTVAEWNIWVDPTAAGDVFASGVPVTLVPLDATNDLPSGRRFFTALNGAATTPAARLVRDVWLDNGDWIDNAEGFFYFWDELAAAVLVDDSLVEFETRSLVVDDDLRENKGWTREDPAAPTDLGFVEATAEETAYLEAVVAIGEERNESFDTLAVEVAAELGYDVETISESESNIVFAEMLRRALEGPFVDELVALEALEPPPGFEELHETLVEVTRVFIDEGPEIVAAFESGGWEALDPYSEGIFAACALLEEAIDVRLLDLDYQCT
jgi:pyrimidine-specific ribonucleoside hydrolase